MDDTPKLTDAEALAIRRMDMSLVEWHGALDSLRTRGLRKASGATPLGRAALEAYDAEQRRAIRVEAMRECEILVEKKTQYSWRGGGHALRSAAAAIRLLIAKEESNG